MRKSSLRESPFAILPGQYFDAETGLHQNWHRDYDPSLGRYLQSDPMGLDGGFNAYAYVDSQPVTYVDPMGLVKWTGSISIAKGSYGPKIRKMRIPVLGFADIKLDLKSECVDGERVVAMIDVDDIQSGDWRHLGLVAYAGSAELDDGLSYPEVSSLEGAFALDSFSVLGGTGYLSAGRATGTFSGGGFALGRIRLSGSAKRMAYTSYKECCQCR